MDSVKNSLKPRVNKTLKTCSVQVIYEFIMCCMSTEQFGKISLQNRRIWVAELETRYTKGNPKTRNLESRVWNPEYGIIEIENEDKKKNTLPQQSSMNKYQFTIYPAEKLPLALIEYWVICPMIRHPPFEATGPTTHVLFLQLTIPTVTFPFPIFIYWWSERFPDSTSVIQTPSFELP